MLRVMNERLLLERLQELGPTSRVELARRTGLSKPTVSAALAGLADSGLVEVVGELAGKPGPVSSLYDLRADAVRVLGVDIGREWIRVAVAGSRGQFLARRDGRNTASTAAELVRSVRTLTHEAANEASVRPEELVCAVIGSPGVFDDVTGRVEFAPNLPGWGQPGLVNKLRRSLGVDLTVENDVNLAAVGEHAYGQGKGKEHFVLVSIGTGIGMGVVIHGQLYLGARGAAGEISYLPTSLDQSNPDIRAHGQSESEIAASGIARAAREAGLKLNTAKEIFDAAAEGSKGAKRIVDAEGRRIGGLLVAVAAVLDPEIVVLSGGVGRNVDLLRKAINLRIAELGPLRPKIVASDLGDSGVLYGAIARALNRAWSVVFERRG
jgi:predicted NBD/HSP70 family sugar kinase